jgi:hypothetical protein
MTSRSSRSWLRHALALALALCAGASVIASQSLVPPTATAGARLGTSVCIGTDTLVAGAPDDSQLAPYAGAAYVFTRNNGQWVERAKLSAPSPRAYSSFGEAVATSRQIVVVGAPFDDTHGDASGAVFVYSKSGDTWHFTTRLACSDPAPGQQFGAALAMDGDTIVVGAYLDNAHGRNAGAAYVFTRSGNRWIQRAKLTASDPSNFAFFGASVAIKGNHILVGAPVAQAAYLFKLHNGAYLECARLSPFGPPSSHYTAFGASVAIDQHTLVVGAPLDSEHSANAGAAFAFRYNTTRVTPHAKLLARSPQADDEFGTSVAIDDFFLAAGAPYAGSHNEGAVTLFHSSQSQWKTHRTVGPSTDTAFFGAAVDLHDDELVTGSPAYGNLPGSTSVHDVRSLP